MYQIHNGDCAEVMASMEDNSMDARSNTDPTFVVKLTGILSPEDIERYEREFKKQLPGRVIVTDNRVEDIREVTSIQPRDAMVTIRCERHVSDHSGGYYEVIDAKQVPAKVWPVAMGEKELLVEWEDGTLGTAKLWDIRMVK